MTKRGFTLRVSCAMLIATFFVAGQTLHAAVGMFGPCYLKSVTPKHAHTGSSGRHSAHHDGCCCDRPTPCDCDLNQGSNNEGPVLPVTAATNSISPSSVDASAVSTRIAVTAYSPEKALCRDWVRARAPSEFLFLDATKLIC